MPGGAYKSSVVRHSLRLGGHSGSEKPDIPVVALVRGKKNWMKAIQVIVGVLWVTGGDLEASLGVTLWWSFLNPYNTLRKVSSAARPRARSRGASEAPLWRNDASTHSYPLQLRGNVALAAPRMGSGVISEGDWVPETSADQ
jgi:hypothetical protein